MVEGRRAFTQQMVDTIFSLSDLGYQEFRTADYVIGLLEKEGFRVTRGVAGMPTAFVASWGSGKPVIGLMADIASAGNARLAGSLITRSAAKGSPASAA